MSTFIPFHYIEAIFNSNKEKLSAIVLSLPCFPVLIKTPALLDIMTGKKWEKTMVSHDLFRIWIASIFYIKSLESDHSGTLWDSIDTSLKHEQQHIFETHNGDAFTLSYLNAYEKAIIKYLHIFKVGGDGMKANEDGSPSMTDFIMMMRPEDMHDMGLDTLLTKTILKPKESKRLDDYCIQHEKDQRKCKIINS